MIDNILHQQLTEFMRRVPKGEFLFRQGDAAETMIFIISGRVQLIGEADKGKYVESVLETGEFLGEKLLLGQERYPRAFSARMECDGMILELMPEQLKELEVNDPSVMADLLKGILQVVAVRFERSNRLIQLLRTSDPVQRLTNVILYVESGVRSESALLEPQFILTIAGIQTYLDMDKETITRGVKDLVSRGILVEHAPHTYSIPDRENLIAYPSQLARSNAA